MNIRCLMPVLAAVALSFSAPSDASIYALPRNGDMVGALKAVTTHRDDTLLDIGRFYDVGYNQITAANPHVDPWLPGQASKVVIPSEYILPPKPWMGIVIDIPARRLYYFPKGDSVVFTYPVGVFLPGWAEPLGTTRILAKDRMPAWYVPKNIHAWFEKKMHMDIPWYWPPGPNNPMGELAMETGLPGIYIHGTFHPWGVGMRASQGCFQMYPENVAQLFPVVPVGTPVRLIDSPYLVGSRAGVVYLQAYKPLRAYHKGGLTDVERAVRAVKGYMDRHHLEDPIDWARVAEAAEHPDTVPVPITAGTPGYREIAAALPARPYAYAPYGPAANNAAMPPSPQPLRAVERPEVRVQVEFPGASPEK